MLKKLVLSLTIAVSFLFFSGCQTYDNSYRTLLDMANHFADCGMPVDVIQPLMPYFDASDGITMLIKGNEIGIYKYDITKKVAKRRLEDIAKKKYVFISAQKYPVLVNGTFILIGYDVNEERNRIIEVFESFE